MDCLEGQNDKFKVKTNIRSLKIVKNITRSEEVILDAKIEMGNSRTMGTCLSNQSIGTLRFTIRRTAFEKHKLIKLQSFHRSCSPGDWK